MKVHIEKSGRERLREWVDRSKFASQAAAARFLDVHPVQLSEWLTGAKRPELKTAHRLEDITGISTESWLLPDVSTDEDEAADEPRKRKTAGR